MAKELTLQRTNHAFNHPSTYHMRRYLWRSLLTLIGPLVILGFYIYICIAFLARPSSNGIVLSNTVNGNWVFYAWFVVSVLMLDWARTGLANIEVYALMDPNLAPHNAQNLMWHTDSNWANPLWWLRAVWSFLLHQVTKTSQRFAVQAHFPGKLWALLSVTMVFPFAAIPLSGLSMQTEQILVNSGKPARIYGPSDASFGTRSALQSFRSRILWQSGRQTTPQQGALLYAPVGTQNVSETYFDDEASYYRSSIETFAGPAVRESIVGRVWGLWSNISCQPVPLNQLKLVSTTSHKNISINICRPSSSDSCNCQWSNLSVAAELSSPASSATLPLWLHATSDGSRDDMNYTFTAADGYTGVPFMVHQTSLDRSPFFSTQNHDNLTLDHCRGKPSEQATTAVFELYSWQSRQVPDALQDGLIANYSEIVQVVHEMDERTGADFHLGERLWFGFGVQCAVTTEAGFANVDPTTRWFSNFTQSPAIQYQDAYLTSSLSHDLYPVQIQAITGFTTDFGNALDIVFYKMLQPPNDESPLQLWDAFHGSLTSQPVNLTVAPEVSTVTDLVLPLLSPIDLQESMYKLLGENIIGLMDESGVQPWYGGANSLQTAPYIVPGPVPWQYVLTLLCIWALATSCGALRMLITRRPRWAATLNGWEMFKFGAQFADEMN